MRKLFIITMLLVIGCVTYAQNQEDFSLRLTSKNRILDRMDENWTTWGCAPIYGEGDSVHVFFATWQNYGTWNKVDWLKTGAIVHAVAATPEGPYTVRETVVDGRGEGYWDATGIINPMVYKFDDKYVLVYTGIDYDKYSSIRGQAIGMKTATSLNGPWTDVHANAPVLSPGDFDTEWDGRGINNPTLVRTPEGKFHLYYKGIPHQTVFPGTNRRIGLAIADNVEGPYVKYEGNPVIDYSPKNFEDPTVWYEDGKFKMLMHDLNILEKGAGIYTESTDGKNWSEFTKGYPSALTAFGVSQRLETPIILLKDGKPDYLFNNRGGSADDKVFSGFVWKINDEPIVKPTISYVATTGDDATGDGSIETPYATLKKAYGLASDGDTIIVAEGVYTKTTSGDLLNISKSILIQGAGAGMTIFENSTDPVSAENKSLGRFAMMSTSGKTLTIEDISIRHCGYYGSSNGGGMINVIVSSGTPGVFTARRCNFIGGMARYGGVIQVASKANNLAVFEDCYFSENYAMPSISNGVYSQPTIYGGGALQVGAYGSVVVRNCVFYNNGTLDNPENTEIAGSSVRGNTINFMSVGTESYATITSSTFIDNGTNGVTPMTLTPAIINSTVQPFKFINNIVVDNTETANAAAVDFAITTENVSQYNDVRNNLFTYVSLASDISLDVSNAANVSYTKASSEVALDGGTVPNVLVNNTGVNYLKASGTKILNQGIIDEDVPSEDMNGVMRTSTPDLGAVQIDQLASILGSTATTKIELFVQDKTVRFMTDELLFVTLYSLTGKKVLTMQTSIGINSLGVANFGVYLVHLVGDSVNETHKVIIS